MELSFRKYHGAGNDFILINNFEKQFVGDKKKLAIDLCKRHFSIGSDGIIFIEKHPDVDFEMDFYNPDGSQSFCGNGSRCAVKFTHDLGIIQNSDIQFKAIDGLHYSNMNNNDISIKMNDVKGIESIKKDYFLNTGSPHYIKFLNNIDGLDIISEAHKIRYNQRFSKEGTNVNFVKILDNGISMRTYERGVENETLSCGTGVTAAALGFAYKTKKDNLVKVNTKGGGLNVDFEREGLGFKNIYLIGSANFVFEGKITL